MKTMHVTPAMQLAAVAAMIAAIVAAVAAQLPELRRYLKIEKM